MCPAGLTARKSLPSPAGCCGKSYHFKGEMRRDRSTLQVERVTSGHSSRGRCEEIDRDTRRRESCTSGDGSGERCGGDRSGHTHQRGLLLEIVQGSVTRRSVGKHVAEKALHVEIAQDLTAKNFTTPRKRHAARTVTRQGKQRSLQQFGYIPTFYPLLPAEKRSCCILSYIRAYSRYVRYDHLSTATRKKYENVLSGATYPRIIPGYAHVGMSR